jgi:mRNA-degrading endonuclease RelE of RelBE toxin-antitoxin system
MEIRRTDRFKKDYQKLPSDIQQRVDQKLRFLLRDPRHPSLRVHKLRGVEALWEFSVTMNYQVIFEIKGEYYVLLGVGPHRIVDRM